MNLLLQTLKSGAQVDGCSLVENLLFHKGGVILILQKQPFVITTYSNHENIDTTKSFNWAITILYIVFVYTVVCYVQTN